jgi:hypothetical protein
MEEIEATVAFVDSTRLPSPFSKPALSIVQLIRFYMAFSINYNACRHILQTHDFGEWRTIFRENSTKNAGIKLK